MASVKTYDPTSVFIAINGLPLDGWADGSFITIERDEPAFTTQVGADGEVSRSKNVGNTATAKISLHQTSKANQILWEMYQADRLSGGGIGAFMMREAGNIVLAAECWVEQVPTVEYAKEGGPREWTIKLANAEFTIVGNDAA